MRPVLASFGWPSLSSLKRLTPRPFLAGALFLAPSKAINPAHGSAHSRQQWATNLGQAGRNRASPPSRPTNPAVPRKPALRPAARVPRRARAIYFWRPLAGRPGGAARGSLEMGARLRITTKRIPRCPGSAGRPAPRSGKSPAGRRAWCSSQVARSRSGLSTLDSRRARGRHLGAAFGIPNAPAAARVHRLAHQPKRPAEPGKPVLRPAGPTFAPDFCTAKFNDTHLGVLNLIARALSLSLS